MPATVRRMPEGYTRSVSHNLVQLRRRRSDFRPDDNALQRLKAVMHERREITADDVAAIAKATHQPEAAVYGVATYYGDLGLKKRGRTRVKVCKGTACFAACGDQSVHWMEDALGVKLAGQGGRGALRGPKALFHVDPSTPADEVQPTIPQALFLMNDPKVQAGISGKNNLAAQVLRIAPNEVFAMEAIYLRVLARHPTKAEGKVFLDSYLRGRPRIEAYEDLVWALINSAEFQSRH